MNEPKRRGRPPKAKLLQPTEPNARVEGEDCPSCGQSVGHYDDCEVGMGVVDGGVQRAVLAQAYAERIWKGQSMSVSRAEKLRRVARALEGQGLSMEGVKL